jgi:hypothetical protein
MNKDGALRIGPQIWGEGGRVGETIEIGRCADPLVCEDGHGAAERVSVHANPAQVQRSTQTGRQRLAVGVRIDAMCHRRQFVEDESNVTGPRLCRNASRGGRGGNAAEIREFGVTIRKGGAGDRSVCVVDRHHDVAVCRESYG